MGCTNKNSVALNTQVKCGLLVREFYQIFGKSGNKFPTKKLLRQYVC